MHAPRHKAGARAQCPSCRTLVRIPGEHDDLVSLNTLRDLTDQVTWQNRSGSQSATSTSVLRRCRHCDGYIAAGQSICEACGLPADTSTLLTKHVSDKIKLEEKRKTYAVKAQSRQRRQRSNATRQNNSSSIWNVIISLFSRK